MFFLLYRFQGVGDVFNRLRNILAPFIYGSVVAYLLRPMCNFFEGILAKYLPKKLKKMAQPVSIALSVAAGILTVYAVIIMIAPELYNSIQGLIMIVCIPLVYKISKSLYKKGIITVTLPEEKE